MNITHNQLPEGEVELTIELTPEEYAPYVTRAAAAIAAEVKIEGFRPGKAPYDIVKARVGEQAIMERASELAIGATYADAVREKNLVTIGYPKVDIIKLAPGNPLVFKARMPVLPKVELHDWRDLKIKPKPAEPVSDETVNKALEDLRKMTAAERQVERAAAKGDRVEIDFDIFVDKVPIEGGTSKNHPMELGSGHFIPGFEDNIVGLTAGQTKEFELTFPKEYHAKHLAGRPAEVKVKLNQVKEVTLPPLDDQFAKRLGNIGSLLELKMKLRENLEAEAKQRADRQLELDIFDALIARTNFAPLPKLLLDEETEKILHEIEHDLQAQGAKFDDYLSSIKKTRDQLKIELAPQAERRVKAALIVREIAVTEKIIASDMETDVEIEKAKKNLPDNPETQTQLASSDFRAYIKNRLIHHKVVELIKKQLVQPTP